MLHHFYVSLCASYVYRRLHNDPETDTIHLRHFEIGVRPSGLTKSVKTLLRKKIPDLSKFDDVGDFVLKGGDGYESDVSDAGGDNKVVLPQTVQGVGNKGNSQSAIKLVELGPRLELSLLKIEDGFCSGDVLYHKHGTCLKHNNTVYDK